jgi:predicted dehydrogenase
VRWTEQRNFDASLHLMQTGQLDLAALTTRRVPFDQCLDVYRDLLGEDAAKNVGVVLEYPAAEDAKLPSHSSAKISGGLRAAVPANVQRLSTPVKIVDAIGAGNFARTMLLPHLKGRIAFGTVVNLTALSANHVKTKFGFAEAATNASAIFGRDERRRSGLTLQSEPAPARPSGSAAVLIATRHNLHAPLVLDALNADRHVFVEKPLCLTRAELSEIDAALTTSSGSVQVGFNRRFAGASVELKKVLESSPGPKTASFRVMPGRLDQTHWYANYAESGGRVLGEVCHFLDYFCFLFDSRPKRVSAQTIWPTSGRPGFPDSVTAQVEFADGSCGQLTYTAEGDSSWPKEVCTVFSAGVVAEIENFQKLTVHRRRRRSVKTFHGKGHAEQMRAWTAFLLGEAEHPLPHEQSRQSMLLTFAVLESIQQGRSTDVF